MKSSLSLASVSSPSSSKLILMLSPHCSLAISLMGLKKEWSRAYWTVSLLRGSKMIVFYRRSTAYLGTLGYLVARSAF